MSSPSSRGGDDEASSTVGVDDPDVISLQVPTSADLERIDRWLVGRLNETRATIQRWIEDGRVLLDGRTCRPKDKVRPDSLIEVRPDLPPPSRAEPDPRVVVDVIYEDEELLVVHKPAGLVVHPGRGHREGTLVNGLLARPGFARPPSDPEDEEGAFRPGIVHRIDKDTSGLLVVAKKEKSREGLKEQLGAHTVVRRYQALTIGVPREGRIATLHARDPKSRLRFSSKVSRGKEAVTHVSVEERLAGGRAAVVACRLETGRTHQIRVHLSGEARAPILGDALYGGQQASSDIAAIGYTLGRQALHAGVLGFRHPTTGQEMLFEAPLPRDMVEALESLRRLGAKKDG